MLSLVQDVEPLNARSKLLPDVTYNTHEPREIRKKTSELTAEKVEAVETLLPHVNCPLDTAHLPLEVDMVKLDADPESVYVARV